MSNKKNSDSSAKDAFKQMIKAFGYIIEETGAVSADIAANIDNDIVYFEIKKTKEDKNKGVIFGAATLTEWQAAMDNAGKYFFVIAKEKEGEQYDFYIISPKDFMKYSYIPPFKIDFHIPYRKEDNERLILGVPGRKINSCVIRKDSDIKTLQKAWDGLDSLKLKECKRGMFPTDDFKLITNPETIIDSIKYIR